MQAQDIVSQLQGNPPIKECIRCMDHWHSLGNFYSIWYKCQSDPASQAFVEMALEEYLKHKQEHKQRIEAIYQITYEYGQLLAKAKPGLDTVTLGLEAARIPLQVEGLGPNQTKTIIDGIIDGYHSIQIINSK